MQPLTCAKDERKMSKFMQYGMAAAQEALEDAKWHPQQLAEQEMTVYSLRTLRDSMTNVC
jgi:3-oxoacyl-(acyl-carrier-protein) synthase